jgi:hypothetical protein
VGYAASGILAALVLGTGLMAQVEYGRDAFKGYQSWAGKEFTRDTRKLMRGWLMEMPLPISDWLNANLTPGSVVAYTEMGLTPYLCPNIRFLDCNGLTDHGVATLPGAAHINHGVIDNYISMNDKVGPYLLNIRKPDYILRGVQLSAGQPPPQDSILDDGYLFHAAIPLPKRPAGYGTGTAETGRTTGASAQEGYMLVWKRRNA